MLLILERVSGLFGTKSRQKRIESFEKITLHTSGMRCTVDYEIVMQAGQAELSRYSVRYTQENTERVPERRALVSEQVILQLLNDCQILSWDGFHGKHPRGVKDGTMFSFTAVVNGGRTIRAEGSQKFPKHYRELTQAICDILATDGNAFA